MGESISAEQMHDMRGQGDVFEVHDNGHRTVEGLSDLVAEIRALVEAQRANAGADMLRSETQSHLIAAVQKLASKAPGKGMSQKVLEDLVVQLAEPNPKDPFPVVVFTFEHNQTSGRISKIIATPVSH